MVFDLSTIAEASGALVTVFGGAYTAIRTLEKTSKAKKDAYRADILKQAKEEAEKVKSELETKIKALEEEFKNQKENVSKDFSHFRDVYSNEIKVLGQRIEELRQDLGVQHSSLVSLLMKLVDKQ